MRRTKKFNDDGEVNNRPHTVMVNRFDAIENSNNENFPNVYDCFNSLRNDVYEVVEKGSAYVREKWFAVTTLCGCQHETLRPA
jgi:hypothetical protein